jgi:transposase InsO family protein
LINLIVDSGAPFNILKKSSIPENFSLINVRKIFYGLNKNYPIESLGMICGICYNHFYNVAFEFDVIDDKECSLPDSINGILGLQSLKDCNLSFPEEKIIFSDKLNFSLIPVDLNPKLSCTVVVDEPKRCDIINSVLKLSHLTPSQFQAFLKLVSKHSKVFFVEGDILEGTTLIEHEIRTKTENPVFVPQFRLPVHLRKEVQLKIDEMLKNNLIEICNKSNYQSPLFLVPKKSMDGIPSYRPVIDFKKLNEIIIEDRFPIPNIDEILYNFRGAKYFSTLDCKQGYHQIPIKPESRHKTAFSLSHQKFQWRVLPMGLVDAGFTFQRLLNSVLSVTIGKFCEVYVDDIVCYSIDYNSHLKHLETIFRLLSEANLKIEAKKCAFAQNSVSYLGHVVTENGLLPNEDKIKAIRDFKQPTTLKQTRSFLGLINYYRKYFKDFSTLTYPINKLLKKNNKVFAWSEEASVAFENLKKKMIEPPILAYPDFNKTFIITCDASNVAVGSVLSQLGDDGLDHPIGFASRSLNKSEKNYSTYDREFLALLWSITKQWRAFVYGRKFILITDHMPLISILTSRLDNGTSRVVRWKTKLLEFDFKIVYRKGSLNKIADFLSRIKDSPASGFVFDNDETSSKMLHCNTLISRDISSFKAVNVFIITRNMSKASDDENVLKYLRFIKEEKNKSSLKLPKSITESEKELNFDDDNFLKVLFVSKDHQDLPENLNNIFNHKIFRVGEHVCEKNVLLSIVKENSEDSVDEKSMFLAILKLREFLLPSQFKKIQIKIPFQENSIPYFLFSQMVGYVFKTDSFQICLFKNQAKAVTNEDEKLNLIRQYHSNVLSGHFGVSGTYNRLKKFYSWNRMKDYVEKFIRNCKDCQLNKRTVKPPIPLKLTSSSSFAFETVAIDIMGPLTQSRNGNLYLLTILDDLTRYLVAIPLPAMDARTIADAFVTRFICIYATPKFCLSDNAQNFLSNVFKECCKLFKIKRLYTTPYHPQSNWDERIHQNVKSYLRIFTEKNHENWCELIPYCLFSYNTKIHSSLGHSPHELVFGREASLPFKENVNPPKIYSFDDYVENLKYVLKKLASDANENSQKSKESRKIRFDVKAKPFILNIGDLVKLKANHNKIGGKLNPLWKGPYQVSKINSNEYVTILVDGKEKKFHKNILARYHNDSDEDLI